MLAEGEEPIRIADGPDLVLEWVERTFDRAAGGGGARDGRRPGTAIGVPGPVEVATGRPANPPLMPGWDGYPVAERLAERFGAPALLERDVNAMAIGEHRRHWRDLSNMVFVKVATGIGAGIISGGELLRGNHGRAGDIGHIRAIRESDVMCTCGNRGCVAVLASGSRGDPAARARRGSRSLRPPTSSSWSRPATRWRCITCARRAACWARRSPPWSASSRRA